MSLVHEAIDGVKHTEERKAFGIVNGIDIWVLKTSYEKQLGGTYWRIDVYADNKSGYPDAKSERLVPAEAEELFQKLVDQHNLTET